MQRRMVIGVFLVLAMVALSTAVSANPGGVVITKFETEKVIYKPKEPVVFNIEFAPIDNHQNKTSKEYDVQVWVESELNPPVKVASKNLILKPEQVVQAPIYNQPFIATPEMINAKLQKLNLEWVSADKDNVFGHRAWLRIVDKGGRLLAEKETFFDVTAEWWHVMRLALGGAGAFADPGKEKQIEGRVRNMRKGYYNAFEIFKYAPEPYHLTPTEDQWLWQHHRGRDMKVSKKALLEWSKELRKNGMSYVAYHETSAVHGPDEWKTYHKWAHDGKKPYAHYYEKKGMFTPNSIKIADRFAKELEGTINMFGFDGVMMDSAFKCHVQTSKATNINGNQLTDLNAGEVGYIYLDEARKRARKANPDFAFISQNAANFYRLLLADKTLLPTDEIYADVKAHVKKFNALHYSQLVDMWTLENCAQRTPRDGRYPRTYERMSLTLNSIIEVTGKPLMTWAFLGTGGPKPGIKRTRPYMALLLASRTKIHDHNDAFGGAWSNGHNAPASRQVIKYNRFTARYSWYLWDPELKWLYNPKKDIKVEASRKLLWDRVVYQRKLANGKTQTIINILNLPEDGQIIGQTQIAPKAQNVDLKIGGKRDITRVVFLDADDDSLTPLTLEKDRDEGEFQVYRVPPITCWGIAIVESN